VLKNFIFQLFGVALLCISAAAQTQDPTSQQTTRDQSRTGKTTSREEPDVMPDDQEDQSRMNPGDDINRPDATRLEEERNRARRDQIGEKREKPTEEDLKSQRDLQLQRELLRKLNEIKEPDIPFQQFVAGAVGSKLPIFGQDLFQAQIPTFTPVDQIPAPAEYVIGPGDELLIQI